VHTVTVTLPGAGGPHVVLGHADVASAWLVPAQTETSTTVPDKGPSPIAPEPKELLWSLGAFVVFLVVMRLYLFPKVKKGMEARYGKIRGDHDAAAAIRAEAEHEVVEYQNQLNAVKAEANARIDAVRNQLEAERTARLAEVNEQIAAQRAAAVEAAEQLRLAARGTIELAVTDVANQIVELSIGKRPDPSVVQRAVADAMSVGVG
jgi:F-type H+-transporting ATPase subunit b